MNFNFAEHTRSLSPKRTIVVFAIIDNGQISQPDCVETFTYSILAKDNWHAERPAPNFLHALTANRSMALEV